VTETSDSRIEVRGSGEEGKMAPHPASEREMTMVVEVVGGVPEKGDRGESGEGDEREDGGTEGRGEDGTTGEAPVMKTG
jgi:hypothetical protein